MFPPPPSPPELPPPLDPPRPRGLEPRERELVLRERDVLARFGFAAPELVVLVREPEDAFRAPDERDAPDSDDFARLELDFLVLPLDRAPLAFEVPERPPLDLRAPLLRDADDEPELVPALALSSTDHLPDMTRCAASATASAMSEPSLVALAITLFAAWVAVSAASRPASRIARLAFGLALIAAAAAARPAASISLLIAALASLSTVSLPDEEEPDELLRADFAIASSP